MPFTLRTDRRSGGDRRAPRAIGAGDQQYKSLFDHHPDAVYSFDLDGRFTSWNAGAAELVGGEQHLQGSFQELIHPADLPRVLEHFTATTRGEAQGYDCRLVRPDGGLRFLHVTNVPIVVDGGVVGVYGLANDVTPRVLAEQRLEVSQQRYKALFYRNPDPVFSLDLQGRMVSGNEACSAITGYPPHFLQDAPFADLVVPQHVAAATSHFLRALSGEIMDFECHIARRDGSVVQLRIINLPIVVDGRVTGVYGLAKDMTAQHELENELRRSARQDALTQLPNRLELQERVTAQLGAGLDAWLLFVDLDRFKVVNDSLGHEVGDALLQAVVSRLRSVLREEDLLVRFGGDEFCVLLTTATTQQDAQRIAERLRDAIRPGFHGTGHELYVTASVGIAVGHPGENPEELVRRADIAMYQAKAAGRDRVAVYEDIGSQRARTRLAVETELRHALAGGELVLHYQPQLTVDDASGPDRVVGVEALVRWQHPTRGLLAPVDFLPVAESAGLSVPLDAWVLRTALTAAARWQGPDGITVSVNVTPESVLSPGWVDGIARTLTETGLPATRLVVELTEGALLTDPEGVRDVLAQVRAMGVRIALDDFGTGWSSLAYLEQYPVDILKVDRVFVARLAQSTSAPLVQAVLSLAQALNLTTVAEGVESALQRERLLALGCREYQGFLVSPGLPEDQLLALLAARQERVTTAVR